MRKREIFEILGWFNLVMSAFMNFPMCCAICAAAIIVLLMLFIDETNNVWNGFIDEDIEKLAEKYEKTGEYLEDGAKFFFLFTIFMGMAILIFGTITG